MKHKPQKDANYDFADQKAPKKPMGHGSFANMPEKPIIAKFPNEPYYRGGIANDYVTDVQKISEIPENRC